MFTNISFWLSILGATKLITETFGYSIPFPLTNDLTNVIASLLTVYGIIRNHKG